MVGVRGSSPCVPTQQRKHTSTAPKGAVFLFGTVKYRDYDSALKSLMRLTASVTAASSEREPLRILRSDSVA